MTDSQLDTFKEILEDDWYALSTEGNGCEGYKVLKVEGGEDRRWSRYVDTYVEFPDGRIFKWSYDLWEYKESRGGKWAIEPVEVEKYTETITVTKFRKKV